MGGQALAAGAPSASQIEKHRAARAGCQPLVPGNEMTFDGIKDARQRADLLAFLKEATQHGASVAQQGESMLQDYK